MESLTSREYADLIGGLQEGRERLREKGFTGDGVQAVLDKIYGNCRPNTCGMRFELIHAGEND